MKFAVAAVAALHMFVAAPVGAVTAQDVVKLLSRNYQTMKDYQVDVKLTVKGPKISIKGMRMTLYYKQPGKTKVIAKDGMGFLPKEMVFQATVQDMVKQSKVTYLGEESKNSVNCYLIKLEPKPTPPPKYSPGYQPPPQAQDSVKMWIDKRTGGVVSTLINTGYPGSYQTTVISNWTHQLVDNKFYMPAEIALEARETYPKGREGENMSLRIAFSGYKINRGLPDSLFVEQKKPQSRTHRHRPPGPPPPKK